MQRHARETSIARRAKRVMSNTFFEGVHDISSLFHSGDHALECRRDQDHVVKRQKNSSSSRAGRGDRACSQTSPAPRTGLREAGRHAQERGARAGGVPAVEREVSGRGSAGGEGIFAFLHAIRSTPYQPPSPRSSKRSREAAHAGQGWP